MFCHAKVIIDIISISVIGDSVSATTIAVSSETKEMLRHFGEKGESYNHIIKKLIKEAGWNKLDERWNKILANDEFVTL